MAMNPEDFKKQLEYGKEVEILTQQIFMQMDWFVIPKYLYVEKGAPCLLGMEYKYCVPDLDVASNGRRFWVETKRKRLRNHYPDTGFSKRLFDQYLRVQEITGSSVYIIFFDEKLNLVYGNWLNNLKKPYEINIDGIKKLKYPLEQKGDIKKETIIYFPYPDAFKTISALNSLNVSLDGFKNVFNPNFNKLNNRLILKQSQIIEYI